MKLLDIKKWNILYNLSLCRVYATLLYYFLLQIDLQLNEMMTFNMCVCGNTYCCIISLSPSLSSQLSPPLPHHSPSLASGCGCSGCSGGLGPDEAEKGSTAVLSLWLPAPSPPPHIMNNGTEKYIYLLIAPAPWLRPFSLARTATAQGWGFWTPHPTRDCLCSFWSWVLLSVLEMGNQAWFWKGQAIFWRGGHPQVRPKRAVLVVCARNTVISSDIFTPQFGI